MIKKTFICDESRLRDMISFVMQGLKKLDIAENKTNRIHVISEEILTNIISYAYADTPPQNPSKRTITINLDANKEKPVLSFIDKGKYYDFDSLLNEACPMTKPQIGGRGIYLIKKFKKLAESVEYVRGNNKNILNIFIKNV